MTKWYGIFDVCIDGRQADSFAIKKTRLVMKLLEEMAAGRPSPWFIKAKKVYPSRTHNELQQCLRTLRECDRQEDKLRLSHRFRTKYFIHETDEEGWLKPSRAEMKAAEALKARDEEAEEEAKSRAL